MEDLWGLGRATGHGGRTTLQSSSRTQSHHFNVDLNDHNMENIPEEPELHVTQCETPRSVDPNVDAYNPDPNLTPPLVPPHPSQPSGGTSSSRGSKRKALMVDVIDFQLERLNTRFEGLTDILGRVVISQIGYVILLSDKPFHLRLSLCHHNEWLMLRKKICNITDAMLLQKKNETPYFVNTRAHFVVHRLSSTLNMISGKC